MPKLKAIGTPAKMQMPTMPTKKISRSAVADRVKHRLQQPQADADHEPNAAA